MRKLAWNREPSARLLQVFDRRRSRGCWLYSQAGEAAARLEAAKRKGSEILIVEEYSAKLPHWGHAYRIVVGRLNI